MSEDQTTSVELYFVAFYKHGKPQNVVAGPFLDWDTANEDALLRGARHVVVKSDPIPLTAAGL